MMKPSFVQVVACSRASCTCRANFATHSSAKQQVLHSLTPANTEAFLDGILSLLEDEERLDPNFIEGVSDTQGSLLTHFLCKQRLALLFEETRLLFQLMSRTCQMCKVACEHIPRQSKFCTADYTVI